MQENYTDRRQADEKQINLIHGQLGQYMQLQRRGEGNTKPQHLAAKQQFKAFHRVIAIAARPEASSNRAVG